MHSVHHVHLLPEDVQTTETQSSHRPQLGSPVFGWVAWPQKGAELSQWETEYADSDRIPHPPYLVMGE